MPPPHRGRLTDMAYQRLKEDIDAGVFKPGSVVKEADLVMRFNMSRTPVREAVQRLLTEGYIQQLHRGFVVVELSDTELMNIYRVRGVLEGMAARQAAGSRSRVDLALLQDIHEKQLDELNGDNDRDRIAALSDEFHDALARASHNEFLISVLELARRRAEPYRRRLLSPGMNTKVSNDHERIIDAIASGDRSQAELAARLHTRRTLRVLRGAGEPTEQDEAEELDMIRTLDNASLNPTAN
jgi:DNA-binding GntR family transcriptional regulator